jgi:hypothetical protein
MLRLLQNGDFATFLLVDVVGCLLLAMVDDVLSATLCELFPTQVRASGIGLPYAICSAIFSGTAPLIAAWLLSMHKPDLLAVYIMTISAIGDVTFWKIAGAEQQPADVTLGALPDRGLMLGCRDTVSGDWVCPKQR